MSRFVVYLLLFCFFVRKIYCQDPEVEIPQGKLRGGNRTNFDGGTYYSFQNIPYAKPPLGELRFRAPQPADQWEGTRDGTETLPSCVQEGNASGQEDCLYLSVYTPGLPEENVTQLPVMVYIHGGKFIRGSASESLYGARFILTKKVILVPINYRVGVFGFLNLDDADLSVTGNAAMKDQVLALEWVRDNIEYFGGDPNNVLLFGESAGSTSVQFHLVSPKSKGLFHKAISQSGTAITPLLDPVTRNTGMAIAEALGIQTDNKEEMLASLQQVSANDLALAELSFDVGYFRRFSAPIVEIPSNDSFLERRPMDVIRSGDYNQVPIIIGANDAEGLVFQLYSRQASDGNILLEDFNTFVPNEFNVGGTILEDLLGIVIRQFYYGDTQPNRNNITTAVELSGDYGYIFTSYRAAREYVKTAENPIYFYYFTAITELNYLKRQDETLAEFPGVSHADDIGYLFYMTDTPAIVPGSVEEFGVRNIVNLWTNFAIYGNPTPESSSDFIWEPIMDEQFKYLHIGTEESYLVTNSVFTPERMEFWWSLHEQYSTR